MTRALMALAAILFGMSFGAILALIAMGQPSWGQDISPPPSYPDTFPYDDGSWPAPTFNPYLGRNPVGIDLPGGHSATAWPLNNGGWIILGPSGGGTIVNGPGPLVVPGQ